jgi:hypothetical protein
MSRSTAVARLHRVLRPVTLALALGVAPRILAAQSHIVIRVGHLIDGKGGVRDNVAIVVDD